jgi:hypothetical protein
MRAQARALSHVVIPGVQELIEAGDINRLLRAVDAACEARAWDSLLDLADRCEDALERGKQLWPIAAHVDYRVALEAPGDYAALVLAPGVGRFALGPLTEVAASSHTWAELAPHVELPQVAAYLVQERVLRGEVLTGARGAHAEVLELPLELQAWEPAYCLARFGATFVEVAEPWEPAAPLVDVLGDAGEPEDDPELVDALLDLVQPWTSESNGAARAVIVGGDARAAASELTPSHLRIGELSATEAMQRMAWAASSGGARGRRRGATLGRFLAWYTASLAAGLSWPVEPRALERGLGHLRWYRFDEGEPEQGWHLRLAVEHREEGWAAALAASDLLESDEEPAGRRSLFED